MLIQGWERTFRHQVKPSGNAKRVGYHLIVGVSKLWTSRSRAGVGIGGFLKMVLAATSSASRVASAPPRLCPQMVSDVTGLGKAAADKNCATLAEPAATPVVRDKYIAVKPSSVCPAPAKKGHFTSRNSASSIHS